jgi:hypothetical protein
LPRKTNHYNLGPILENEGTIDGTYKVIDNVFLEQLGYHQSDDFANILHLIYGDQKTVSLIQAVQKERRGSMLSYDNYDWILPIPGLFHWRMNYMDMIHGLYSGLESDSISSTLHHNKNFMGCVQGHKSPFHHKEEVAIHAFNARVTALYYQFLPPGTKRQYHEDVDLYIRRSGRAGFLNTVEKIRQSIFAFPEQCRSSSKPTKSSSKRANLRDENESESQNIPVILNIQPMPSFFNKWKFIKLLNLP